MERFSGGMERLAGEIRRSHEDCARSLTGMRDRVHSLLSESRTTRANMAADFVQAASRQTEALRKCAREREREVKAFLSNSRKARPDLARVRAEVDRLRCNTAQFRADTARDHQELSNRVKDDLVRFVTDMKTGVTGFVAAAQKRRLDFAAEFRRGGNALRRVLHGGTAGCGRSAPSAHGTKAPCGNALPKKPAPAFAAADPVKPQAAGRPDAFRFEAADAGFTRREVGGTLRLEDLHLAERIRSTLRDAGFATLDQLTAKTEDELLQIAGIGRSTLHEIQKSLRKRGFNLKT